MNAHEAAQIAAQNFYLISTLVTLVLTAVGTLIAASGK